MPGKGPVRSRRNGSGLTRKISFSRRTYYLRPSSNSISASTHNVLTCTTGGKADVRDLEGPVHVRCSSGHVVDDIWTSIFVDGGYAEQLTHRRRAAVVSTRWRCTIPTAVSPHMGFRTCLHSALFELQHHNSILELRGTALRLVCLCVHQETPLRIRPLDAWR